MNQKVWMFFKTEDKVDTKCGRDDDFDDTSVDNDLDYSVKDKVITFSPGKRRYFNGSWIIKERTKNTLLLVYGLGRDISLELKLTKVY